MSSLAHPFTSPLPTFSGNDAILIFHDFDVESYTRSSFGPMRARMHGLDEDLSEPLESALAYVGRSLQNTSTWLSHVLVTQTHKNPRITAFLTTWAYEQFWMGDALLALSHLPAAPDVPQEGLSARLRALSPLRAAIMANVHGQALTGVQMAERLIDNWLSDAMLAHIQKSVPANVAEDIGEIRIALLRQGQFFAAEAERELAASGATRRLARKRLKNRSWPLGVAHKSHIHTGRRLHDVFGRDRAWAKELDDQIDQLPGLKHMRLMQHAVKR